MPEARTSQEPNETPLHVAVLSRLKDVNNILPSRGDLVELHVLAPPSELNDSGLMPRHDVRYWASETSGQANWCLRLIGSPVRIDDYCTSSFAARVENFTRLFLHLSPNGRYFFHRTDEASWPDFATLFLKLKIYAINGQIDKLPNINLEPLIAFIGNISISDSTICLEKKGYHLLKIRDADATRVLKARNRSDQVEVLEERPKYDWFAQNAPTHFPAQAPVSDFPGKIIVPTRYLREYTGSVRLVRQGLSTQQNVVLPQSFRFHLEKDPRNSRLKNISSDFATLLGDYNGSWERLDGSFYDLDSENSGHFGHLVTEVASRLWGWQEAKKHDPDLKVIFRLRHPGERRPQLELDLFSAYGIAPDDIVWAGNQLRVTTLVSATPQWHDQIPYYADRDIIETWDRLASGLRIEAPSFPERIFVSRKKSTENRSCSNLEEVETLFMKLGFTIFYPEDYSLSEQAAAFEGAKVVAGFGGSAMFSLMYSRKVEHIIVLSQTAYTARNEYLYSAVLGVPITYFWSEPEVHHPVGGWTWDAYFSSWSFNFEQLESDLVALCRSL